MIIKSNNVKIKKDLSFEKPDRKVSEMVAGPGPSTFNILAEAEKNNKGSIKIIEQSNNNSQLLSESQNIQNSNQTQNQNAYSYVSNEHHFTFTYLPSG